MYVEELGAAFMYRYYVQWHYGLWTQRRNSYQYHADGIKISNSSLGVLLSCETIVPRLSQE